MITTFTVTGADSSVQPAELKQLSFEYPFVEWGILVSLKQQGSFRFPPMEWIQELASIKHEGMKLSVHLCGQYVRDLCMGVDSYRQNLIAADVWDIFDRVQINTHGERHDFRAEEMLNCIEKDPEKEFIFQRDEVNNHLLDYVIAFGCAETKRSTLFDLSHGAGILPEAWPAQLEGVNCGYAGGLSPENLNAQLVKIDQVTWPHETWIDIETHVRSEKGTLFNLVKVEQCLKTLRNYNANGARP